METWTANEAKQSLGQLLDTVQREPVLIRKHNREAAIVISPREYDRLRGINVTQFAAFCDRVGKRAAAKGLSESGLEKLLAGK